MEITGNETVYKIVTDKSTVSTDIEFFIKRYQRKIERLRALQNGKIKDVREQLNIIWNDTCAKTSFKFKPKKQ